MLIITLSGNGLKSPIKKHRVVEWIKKTKPNYSLPLGDPSKVPLPYTGEESVSSLLWPPVISALGVPSFILKERIRQGLSLPWLSS